jgi:glycosyltransferase involved in cell wall biosynthesis
MNIAYDNIVFSLQKAGGISNYWYQLVKMLQNDSDHNVVFYESENNNLFRKKLNLNSLKENILPVQLLRYLPFSKNLPPKSIFHSSYYRICLQKNVVNITTVHDFIYEYYGSMGSLSQIVHCSQKYFSVSRSQGIICISENTKKDLLKFYPFINPDIVKVVYHGVDQEFKPLANKPFHLSELNQSLKPLKYILYVGNRNSYKNFSKVVEVVALNPDLSLVVVGGEKFSDEEKVLFLSLKERIFHFQGIDSAGLNVLYNNAFCLLYPSIYEGFGIPPAEAMKAGCPVISSNVSSIPEVVGDAGLLVNDITVNTLADQVHILRDEVTRKTVIDKGIKQVEKFSWDRCCEETIRFYEEIYKRSL